MEKQKSLIGRAVCFTEEACELFTTVSPVEIFYVFDSRATRGGYEFKGAMRDVAGKQIPGTVRTFYREDVRIVGE